MKKIFTLPLIPIFTLTSCSNTSETDSKSDTESENSVKFREVFKGLIR